MKKVYCRIEKCLACRSCEFACALEHSSLENIADMIHEEIKPEPRIHIQVVDEHGALRPVRTMAVQCRHCEEPLCVQACISGGLRKDEHNGNVLVDPGKCVACWSCIMVCPIGAITKCDSFHQALKCDGCPERNLPACVAACPTQALIYCDNDVIEEEQL